MLEVMNILILVSLSIVIYLGKFYIPKYLSKKAENLATKEDIEGITFKVESIKNEFAHTLEETKHHLQLENLYREVFFKKSLAAIEDIDTLLRELTIYCWGKLTSSDKFRKQYDWAQVCNLETANDLKYYVVAIDRAVMIHGLYLPKQSKLILFELTDKIRKVAFVESPDASSVPEEKLISVTEHGYKVILSSTETAQQKLLVSIGVDVKN
ncbi:hypothetical protein ACMZOO_17820 (plasmid) [Catenovulum sp. SX2]|uniref:hypothetical protein n=1 Tax=Catenovulum sp. SX2 TaxID=3398614 RepID=UPI003F845739